MVWPCKVKLGLSHHSISDGAVQQDKQLVFVLDNRSSEEEPKKRKRGAKGNKGNKGNKGGPTFKNFGAYVQPTKIKGCSKLEIGWRIRQMIDEKT